LLNDEGKHAASMPSPFRNFFLSASSCCCAAASRAARSISALSSSSLRSHCRAARRPPTALRATRARRCAPPPSRTGRVRHSATDPAFSTRSPLGEHDLFRAGPRACARVHPRARDASQQSAPRPPPSPGPGSRRRAGPPFGVRQALRSSVTSPPCETTPRAFPVRHLRLHDRFTHLPRQVAEVSRRRSRRPGPRGTHLGGVFEQRGSLGQLLRTVLAKNGENTGCTAREPHLGRRAAAGRGSSIGSWRVNRSLHFVQAYS